VLFDQCGAEAPYGGIPRDARADDCPADHEHIEWIGRNRIGRRGTSLIEGNPWHLRFFLFSSFPRSAW
jgi:hypothetical protein